MEYLVQMETDTGKSAAGIKSLALQQTADTTQQRVHTGAGGKIVQRYFAAGSAKILVAAVTPKNDTGLVIAYHAHGTIVHHQSTFG